MNTISEQVAADQDQGREIFRATLAKSQRLISEGHATPGAVIAGLLAVASEVATAEFGPAEAARILRLTALSLENESKMN